MTLHDFETALPAAILKKGHGYFNDGKVIYLEQPESGQWEATVSGTEDYDVNIDLDASGIIEEVFCDCPHDATYCKHVVATLYAIRDELGTQQPVATPSKNLPPAAKEKDSAASDFATLLAKIPAEELREFLRGYAKKDAALRNLFLAHFAEAIGGEAKEKYAAIIRSAAKSATRAGYIEYSAAPKIVKPVQALLSQADAALAKKHYTTAYAIAAAVIEEVYGLFDRIDDSRGTAAECVDHGFDLLSQLAQSHDVPPDLQDAVFDYALGEAAKKKYDGYGFENAWLDLLLCFEPTRPQADAILGLLDKKLAAARGNTHHARYDRSRLLQYQTALLARAGRADEADALRRQHLDLPEIRAQLVAEHLKVEAYEPAKTLLRDGIALAKKEQLPGVAKQFRDVLLHIAQRQDDTAALRLLASALFEDTRDMAYYRLLKKSHAEAEWPAVAEDIITRLQPGDDLFDWRRAAVSDALAAVFIEEGFSDRLMALVEAAPSLTTAGRYYQYLLPLYPERVLRLYESALIRYAAEHTDRSHYKVIRDVLKQMKGWEGGPAVVASLLADFRESYPKRRAMMDELGKVG